MAVMITGQLVSFADEDGGYCGNGVLEEILIFLRHHHGGGGGGGNGDPIGPVKLSDEVRSELGELGRTLVETAERFEQIAARAVKEGAAAARR
jgi:hypothetical protein